MSAPTEAVMEHERCTAVASFVASALAAEAMTLLLIRACVRLAPLRFAGTAESSWRGSAPPHTQLVTACLHAIACKLPRYATFAPQPLRANAAKTHRQRAGEPPTLPPSPDFSACARAPRAAGAARAAMDATGGPQILELACKSLPITIYDTKCVQQRGVLCRAALTRLAQVGACFCALRGAGRARSRDGRAAGTPPSQLASHPLAR